jgi:hypothetical protein
MIRRFERPSGDGGFALMEVLAAMGVLAIFFGMFTGAIVTTFDSSNHSQGIARTTQELSRAFERLDTQVRYASYLATPGQVAGDGNNWYLELQDTNQDPARCIQLRVDRASEQLQQRSWPVGGATSAWLPLASGVVNGAATGADAPFVVTRPDQKVRAVQLTLNLVTSQGSGGGAVSSRTQLTFTALNTNLTTPQGGLCTGMRP